MTQVRVKKYFAEKLLQLLHYKVLSRVNPNPNTHVL